MLFAPLHVILSERSESNPKGAKRNLAKGRKATFITLARDDMPSRRLVPSAWIQKKSENFVLGLFWSW